MDHDELVNKHLVRIARDDRCTVNEVNAALDRHPIEVDRDQYLRRTVAMELIELDELAHVFRAKAVDERDPVSGALCVKIHERRATLLGLNPPIGHAVRIVQHAPVDRNTDKI
jgi:hypothetical protein